MKGDVITIDSASTVRDAARKMNDNGIGCVVITDGQSPVGIITERDFVRRIALNERPLSTIVREVMSSPLISIDPDATVWEVAEKMKLEKIRKIPVITGGKLVGIVTTTDITRLCSIGSDSEMRTVCQQILHRLNQS